jgi:hypothetical protein
MMRLVDSAEKPGIRLARRLALAMVCHGSAIGRAKLLLSRCSSSPEPLVKTRLKAGQNLAWARNFHKEARSAESAAEALLIMAGDEIRNQPASDQ